MAVQSTGKVVIAGAFEHDPTAAGDAGRTPTSPSPASTGRRPRHHLRRRRHHQGRRLHRHLPPAGGRVPATTTSLVGDSAYGMTALPDDRLLVVGRPRRRVRVDRRRLRRPDVHRNGQLDPGLGTADILTVDVLGGHESPRQALVQPDGKIVFNGYTRTTATPAVVRPALVRISANGALDPTFGTGGIGGASSWSRSARPTTCLQATNSHRGYGRPGRRGEGRHAGRRFTSTGALDATFGTNGLVRIDIAGDDDRAGTWSCCPTIASSSPAAPPRRHQHQRRPLPARRGRRPQRAFSTNGVLQVDLGGPSDAFSAWLSPPTARTPSSTATRAPTPPPATTRGGPGGPVRGMTSALLGALNDPVIAPGLPNQDPARPRVPPDGPAPGSTCRCGSPRRCAILGSSPEEPHERFRWWRIEPLPPRWPEFRRDSAYGFLSNPRPDQAAAHSQQRLAWVPRGQLSTVKGGHIVIRAPG